MDDSIAACRTCGLVQDVGDVPEGSAAVCPRCSAEVTRRKPDAAVHTLLLSLAGLILYLPANIYPIVSVTEYGRHSEATLWDSCKELLTTGNWAVGILVFCTSILTPCLKLLSLLFISLASGSGRWQRERTAIYRFVEFINPWNMLEIFMLALVVGVAKFGAVADVRPGFGAVAFGGVVVFTIMAAQAYDPRLIWDAREEDR